MPRELDPIWKHVERGENDKWKCKYCGTESHGRVTRIRAHLAGIPGYGIKVCEKVEDPVRAEALQKIKGKGSVLDISTGGTWGEGTKRIVIGASQSVLPSDNASDPNDTQNSGQLGCVPQQPSFHQPTGSGTAPACPQDQGSLPPGDRPLDNLDNTQQSDPSNHRLDAAHGNENASSLPQHLMDSSALPSLDLGELLEPLEQSTHLEFRDVITPDVPLHSPQSNLHNFPLENFREFFAEVFKEIEADELHDPAVVSSLQIDPSLDVDRANRLQDCGQPRRVEVVPVPSNRRPTNIVQHPGQLPPRCDKEDGNDIRPFPSPTQMEIYPSSASLHTSGSHILEATIVDSLVVQASTDTVVPSSSHALVPPSSSRVPHNAPPPRILPCGTGLIGPSSLPDGVTLNTWLYSPENLHDSLPENRLESHNVDVSTSEEIQTNELHNPTAGSSLQMDPSLDVDRADGLHDCVQPSVAEGVPARSNTSPTDTVQHPCQLPQRCDKEDGNDICRFPSQTPMVIDPSTALQHPTDSHIFEATNVHLLVPGTSTNPIGPSSSHASVRPQRQIVPHRSINIQTVHQNPTVPSSSWENRLVTGHPQALMDMDPCMPSSSQAPNNAPPLPQILPCGTGLIGRSSLPELDMNEGAPMTSHPNTCNIFEESGALKRKLEQIFSKEAHIREELKFGASLSLKKPRMEVSNWLVAM